MARDAAARGEKMQICHAVGFTFGRLWSQLNKTGVCGRRVLTYVKPENKYDYEVIDDYEDRGGGHVHVAAFRLVRCTQAL